MTNAERIISICHKALDPGPMGSCLRAAFYKEFVAVERDVDLSHVKTSCAVFVHSVLHFAGRLDQRPDRIGMGIFDGWLEGLHYQHKAWEDAVGKDGKRRQPPPGAIFYRAYSKSSSGAESHVGILLFQTPDGNWFTAEGGGSPSTADIQEWKLTSAQVKELNGTLCRISPKAKDVWAKDSLGRVLVGWWRPELLDNFVPETSDVPTAYQTLPNGAVLVGGVEPVIALQSHQLFVDKTMRWGREAAVAAADNKVPLHWVLGVIWAESTGNPAALSPDGGYGLMQLTHSSVFDGEPKDSTLDNSSTKLDDVTDPARNIALGTRLLGRIRASVGDDLVKAASCYNAGSEASGQPHPGTGPFGYRETPGYIYRVIQGANSALREIANLTPAYTTSYIKEWQRLLKVADDGKFGPATLEASKKAIGK